MNVKKFKEAFKNFVKEAFEDMPPEKVEVKLVTGEIVEVDKLDVGGVAMKGGTSLPDGTYELETGETITIAAGLISEVKPKVEMQNEPAPPAPPAKEDEKMEALSKNIFSALDKIEANVMQRLDTIEAKQKATETSFAKLNTTVQSFADETPEKPTHVDWDSLTPLERRKFIKGK